MSQSIAYDTILEARQNLRYNWPDTDANSNAGYRFVAIVTDIRTQASTTGDVRDIQTITKYGGFQTTPFTPQQIYSTLNASTTAGNDLAAELKAAYNQATATVVS